LVSVVQNIFFLPFRFLYERFYVDLKAFEHALKKTKSDEQSFLLNTNVRKGNASVIFYIINFVILFIAFISAGRVFLLEFYRTPINKAFLYSYIPYPEYPLKGVIFHFPFIDITSTTAVSWQYIFLLWAIPIGFFVILRLLWRVLKPLLSKSKLLLRYRIGYNHLIIIIGSFIGTLIILSTILLRHFPTSAHFYYLTADLSHQNTTFNIITAVCTFFAALYSGFQHNREESAEARKAGIPEPIIAIVSKNTFKNSFRNGILLGVFAFWVTRLMPCSHDLSVLAFEALYVSSPITFDLIIPRSKHRA
ncbi:MAG: hypothetical protein NTY75_05090, partial [Candidatus Shapirobacteria bacterium]|nr:hypothetical protein [Candidatus Shapirobacteria bacterium]